MPRFLFLGVFQKPYRFLTLDSSSIRSGTARKEPEASKKLPFPKFLVKDLLYSYKRS